MDDARPSVSILERDTMIGASAITGRTTAMEPGLDIILDQIGGFTYTCLQLADTPELRSALLAQQNLIR